MFYFTIIIELIVLIFILLSRSKIVSELIVSTLVLFTIGNTVFTSVFNNTGILILFYIIATILSPMLLRQLNVSTSNR